MPGPAQVNLWGIFVTGLLAGGASCAASSPPTSCLLAGRYELVCNLPGHYPAGKYTQLNVT